MQTILEEFFLSMSSLLERKWLEGLDALKKMQASAFSKTEGHFIHWKKRTRFFQNKRIYTDF